MPTWGQQLQELNKIERDRVRLGQPPPGSPSAHDILRRKYLKALSERTGRATIVYSTGFLEARGGNVDARAFAISLGDVQGFMEAVSNVEERELDLILHSPGGSAEAAESIVEYLRARFDHIRVIVPVAAMSAATMISLAADEIVMGSHSQLGPIDPQFTVMMPEGPRSAPGQAILDQFELAKSECAANPKNVGAWMPILRSLAPGLIAQCGHQRDLAADFAQRWLERFMFKDEGADAAKKAEKAAAWFADFDEFKSHGRRVSRDDARRQGLRVVDLEDDDHLQDAVLSVHHAVHHTLAGTGTTKLIENHHGRAYIEMTQSVQVALPQQVPAPPGVAPPTPTPAPAQPAAPPVGNRKQRRKQQRGR